MDLVKIKNICSAKDPVKGMEKKRLQTRRKYLQIIYPTKNLYLEYTKNSQNLAFKKQTMQLENRQKTWTDLSPKMICTKQSQEKMVIIISH